MSKITLSQSSARSGLSEATLRNYIASGTLPAYRLGARLIRIDTDDLDRLLKPISRDSAA